MASSGDVALAFGLVIAAGLCTCLGAAIAFCVKVSDTRILAAALGVSAGVMLYVSFVEIFSTKSIQGFIDAGYSDDSAYRYATLLFFGGMAVTWCLNQAAHGMLHLAAARQAARRERGGAGGGCCGGVCGGLWLRGGGWGRRGAAGDVDLGKQDASTASPSRQLSALQAAASRPGSTSAAAQHLTAPAIATADTRAGADASSSSASSSTHGPGCLAPTPTDAPVTVLGLTAPSPADVEAGGGGGGSAGISPCNGPAGTDLEREVVAVLVAADDPRDHAHTHTHLHRRSHVLPTCICGTSPPGTGGATPSDPEAGNPQAQAPDGAGTEPPHDHSHAQLSHLGLLSGLAVGIHNFPEGLATFVGTLADPTAGVAIAVAIALHNIPEGIVVAMPIYYATGSKWKGFLWSAVCGLSEPVAGLLGWLILRGRDSDPLMYGVMFALVAGMMVYIAAVELLPTALRYDPANRFTTRGLVVGMAVMAASLLLFSAT